MRQRHTVAKAHIQLSVHTVSATLPPVFRLPPSKMDHRRRALLCRVVACCWKKRRKSRKVWCQPWLERQPTLGSYVQIFVVLASDDSTLLQF